MKTTIATLRALLHDRLLVLPWPYTTPQVLDAFDAAAAAMPPPAPGALVTAEELAEVEAAFAAGRDAWKRGHPMSTDTTAQMLAAGPKLAAEVRRLAAALDEAIAGEKLSEERTSALWHAVEAAANGADIEEHLRLLSAMGIDAEPVKTWARLASLLQDARAANEQLRGEIADERKAHAAALAAVQAHAAEVESGADVLRQTITAAETIKDVLRADLDRLREKARVVVTLEHEGAFCVSEQDEPAFDALRAEVDGEAAADRATDAAVLPEVLRRNAALDQRVRELQAEVARLRGEGAAR